MGAFKMGDKFNSVEEYCSYPYSHLFFHGKLIGKAITDNWQFRKIVNDIEFGNLRKAELNDGYKLYEVTALTFDNYTFATKPFVVKAKFVAKSADEAEKKIIKTRFCGECLGTYINHEFEFSDGSGIVKTKAVEVDG